jgi:hypothetical protein
MKEHKRFAFGGLLTIGLVVGMLVAMQTVPNVLDIPGWNTIASAADGNPGAGASGILEIFIYPHQAVPATAYHSNLTSAAAYASRNTLNGACTGNVPYATTFDIVIKCRYNATHAYNTTSSAWMLSWCRGLMTCANLGVGADVLMTAVNITYGATSSTYQWVNFWIADSDGGAGAGFTITHGQVVNVTSFKMQAYY